MVRAYNPTLATIQNCAARLLCNARLFRCSSRHEYLPSGGNQVVFLIEGCRKVRGPDGGPVIREGMKVTE